VVRAELCTTLKQRVGTLSGYRLADQPLGAGVGIHLACRDTGVAVKGAQSAVSVAYTVYLESPNEVFVALAVMLVGTQRVEPTAAAIVSTVRRIASDNASIVPRQHKLDRMKRLRKGGFEAHLNRARSEMRSKAERHSEEAEKAVRDIRRATRRQFAAEEKVRIVIAGLRGEDSIAELCRKEGINQNLYYRWSKDFLEAGKKRLAGDIVHAKRPATT